MIFNNQMKHGLLTNCEELETRVRQRLLENEFNKLTDTKNVTIKTYPQSNPFVVTHDTFSGEPAKIEGQTSRPSLRQNHVAPS